MEIFDTIWQALSEMSWTQYAALLTGIGYVILAARDKITCWYFGIVSCGLIAHDDFFSFQLYADGVLQLLYVILGVFGILQWRFGGKDQMPLSITELPVKTHAWLIGIGFLLTLPLGYALNHFTDAAFSYLDTLTTIFSLIATGLLIRKILSNWLYWIVIDVIYVYLFVSREGYLVALLFSIYCIVAIQGFFFWKSKYDKII